MALDFSTLFTAAGLAQIGQIILADLAMAGDNLVIMGTLAAGLPDKDRKRVLLFGVGMALVFLIGFALIATQLLKITGLVFAGGLLLLWVAWNMLKELRSAQAEHYDDPATPEVEGPKAHKTLLQAAIQITLADLSMSVDNVIAVASIARSNPAMILIGLSFSVMIMGIGANFVSKLMQRFPWISWIGLAVIVWVAGNMVWTGWLGDEHTIGLSTLF